MPTEPTQSFTFPNEAVEMLWRGEMIEAIKLVRVERHLGLKESKDLVDAYLRSQPALRQKLEQAQTVTWQTLKRVIIALIVATAAAYFFFQGR